MCGIVGYVGKGNAPRYLINGLKRLEYRGYDSAGIAVLDPDSSQLHICKAVGKVVNVGNKVNEQWDEETRSNIHIGIAHTRWATHGSPTEPNAHPHRDQSGKIALVHNGIIENYRALKAKLEEQGSQFHSQTDSEVLAHLVGFHYNGDLFQAVTDALKQVEGTFGVSVISEDHPGTIITARRGSPIVLGVGEDESIVASDASAIVSHTSQVIYLDDNDIATVTADSIEIRDLNNVPVSREVAELTWTEEAAEKGGFDHFMAKEINEQPLAINNTVRGRLDLDLGSSVLGGLGRDPRELADIQRVVIVGCGTSMHAGMVGEYAFEDLASIPAEVEQAAEFRYRNPIIGRNDLVIAISQSGETADTLAAIREAKQKGALVMGICNVVGSTIARETGRGVYLHAGPEISVASTKAFTCQVSVLLMLALKLGRTRRLSRNEGLNLCKEIETASTTVEKVLEQDSNIAEIAKCYHENEHMFFIGRGHLFPVALEGALKLKEISYIHAEGYHAAELKHGPIALLEEGTPVVALLNDVPGRDKMIGNVEECKARGAKIIGVITEGDEEAKQACDHYIEIPASHSLVTSITATVALQIFSYHIAKLRGCEIDQPRNLAKSVTVE